MKPLRIVAALLIVLGILGLVYDQFQYTRETHDAKLGPLQFSVAEKETVHVPQWVGIGLIVVGAGLLLFDRRR